VLSSVIIRYLNGTDHCLASAFSVIHSLPYLFLCSYLVLQLYPTLSHCSLNFCRSSSHFSDV